MSQNNQVLRADAVLDEHAAKVQRIRKLKNGVITVCYGQREYWKSRKEAADYFLEGISASDGSECERYSKIYAELICGKKVCSDEYEDL